MPKKLRVILTLGFSMLIFASGFTGYRLLSGKGLGLHAAISFVMNLANVNAVRSVSHGQATNVIFLHHSVGRNLIAEGGMRDQLSQAGISLWDHDYNAIGLRDPSGELLGYSYNIPNDNTDFDGMVTLFTQPIYDLPFNAFSSLLQHEVIIFKSCYPNSNIISDEQLELDRQRFLTIRGIIDQHPDKLFILITQPPLPPADTNLEIAGRARVLSSWLASSSFIEARKNLAVFDFFDRLALDNPQAGDNNMLRVEYRVLGDPHPNSLANQTIGPELSAFILDAIQTFQKTAGVAQN